MRILLAFILIFLVNSFAIGQTKVLFIGNSYTYVNDLPHTLIELSASMGDNVITDQSTPGGYRLMNHASNTTTISKIFSQEWDFVVLQAQSQEPSWSLSQLDSEVFPYAKQLSDSIKKNRACSEILFYSTWGRQNGDDGNCAEWPPVCSFDGMNDRLLIGYYTMAEQNNAAVAPVGMAWKIAREDGLFNSINYYASDGSHPSVYGTYLTACVFYNSIFKKPVENASFYSTISQNEAEYLQSVANSIFDDSFEYFLSDTITDQDYTFNRAAWYENGISVLSNFNYDLNALEMSLSNTSIHGETYSWDFGDNNGSNELEPVYTYSTPGQYDVKLITFGQCGIDTTINTINISTAVNTEDDNYKFQIWSSDGVLYFDNINDIEMIEIFTIDGKKIVSFKNSKAKLSYVINNEPTIIVVNCTTKKNNTITRRILL